MTFARRKKQLGVAAQVGATAPVNNTSAEHPNSQLKSLGSGPSSESSQTQLGLDSGSARARTGFDSDSTWTRLRLESDPKWRNWHFYLLLS